MAQLLHVRCKKLMLISTIDVLPKGAEKYEDVQLPEGSTSAYALHRIKMEQFVQEHFENVTIIRLPGIFGRGLRKNFIFDLIFKIPKMFSVQEFEEFKIILAKDDAALLDMCYQLEENGLYLLRSELPENLLLRLRHLLEEYHRTSLRFTGSRNFYSYYDLGCLKEDLQKILQYNIPLIHMATEPMLASELARKAFEIPFHNEFAGQPPVSSYAKSKYAPLWNGTSGYLYSKEQVLVQLRKFPKDCIQY